VGREIYDGFRAGCFKPINASSDRRKAALAKALRGKRTNLHRKYDHPDPPNLWVGVSMKNSKKKALSWACSLAVCLVAAACDDGKAQKAQQAAFMAEIHDQVVKDSMVQYNMVKRQGGPIDRCVHAGLVAAAYLQAKDESNYATWKTVERTDCEAAGMPPQ
jgi:hypothetical protein